MFCVKKEKTKLIFRKEEIISGLFSFSFTQKKQVSQKNKVISEKEKNLGFEVFFYTKNKTCFKDKYNFERFCLVKPIKKNKFVFPKKNWNKK